MIRFFVGTKEVKDPRFSRFINPPSREDFIRIGDNFYQVCKVIYILHKQHKDTHVSLKKVTSEVVNA